MFQNTGQKLIFVNRFFYPDLSATSQMLSGIAFGLAERGYNVTVLTSRIAYGDSRVSFPKRETVRNVDIVRIPTTNAGRASILGRVADYASFYVSSAAYLSRLVRKNDVVVFKTDPPALSVAMGGICHVKGACQVNWLQDVFPEVATELGFKNFGAKLAFSLLAYLRNRSLRCAAANVAIGHLMSDRIKSFASSIKSPIVIPNWADGRLIRPISEGDNVLRDEWGLADSFVIAYSGNLGRAHDVSTLLSAMEVLSERRHFVERTNLKWLFIGGGAGYKQLQTDVYNSGIQNVIFKPYQSTEKLAASLSAGDVHLISLLPRLEGLIVPSKFYGIAAAGRPSIFIGDPAGELGHVLTSNNAGFTVSMGDSVGLANLIEKLATDRQTCDLMGNNARVAFERHYDLPKALDAWENLILGIDQREH